MSSRNELRNQLYKRDGTTCHYCGIEEDDFARIWGDFYGSKKRGTRLEIDRKDNNKREYDIKNCVLACALCNNAKSDKITYDDFKRVGTVIKEIWQRIGKERGSGLPAAQGFGRRGDRLLNDLWTSDLITE